MVKINKVKEDSLKAIAAAIAGAAIGAAAATAMTNPKFKKKITMLAKQAKEEWDKLKIETNEGKKVLQKKVVKAKKALKKIRNKKSK